MLFSEAVTLMARKVWEPAELFQAFADLTHRHLDAAGPAGSALLEDVQP